MKIDQLISAANAAVTQTSIGVNIGDQREYSVQIDFSSGTLNGTLTLEASNTNVNYVTIAGTSQAIASGASHVYNVSGGNYMYYRVKWVPSSGTGTMTATAVLKEPTNRF